ncbi:hypothetical protein HanHA300_Chr12g0445091 [Helianthus annuus]|nr:hypothetical protein HanHA300_Chr12g0445091 [Helianthus annuus]KAJ0505434.1 hypothetical protein HanHA89_Chr12g0470521 [Helianthus annuus]
MIIRKGQEKIKKTEKSQPKEAKIYKEINAQTHEIDSNSLWKNEFDKQLVNLHMLATTAVNINLY